MMLRLGILGCLAMFAGDAMADELRGAAEVAAGLPPATLKRIQAAPDGYLDRTATIIAGYGGAQGIDAAGIDRYIAVTRAEARARLLGSLLAADLDNDGAVTADEVAELAPLIGARERGRLLRAQVQGDPDSDGMMSARELQAVAEKAGMQRVSAAAATALVGLMAFDLDGNGLVSPIELADVVAAVTRIAPAPARVAARES